jgi:sugar lactone lactonase YvrE
MLRVIGNDQNLPRQEHAVASGTLPNGKPVVVNSDGTVSVISETTVSESVGTPSNITGSQLTRPAVAYDANAQKVVIAYRDNGNSNRGTAIVGTISGTSISFGSSAVFFTGYADQIDITYDSTAQKVVIAYQNVDSGGYGTAVVGTISGTSISFGTNVVFKSAALQSPTKIAYHSAKNRVGIIYKNSSATDNGEIVIGEVSGTSLTFGSSVTFESGLFNDGDIVYDASAERFVTAHKDESTSPANNGFCCVISVGGTGDLVPTVNTRQSFNGTSGTTYISAVYDSANEKVVISFADGANSNAGTAIVATIGSTSATFGTKVQFTSNNVGGTAITYDSGAGKVVVSYRDNTNSNRGTVISGKVSGTSITFDTASVFDSNNISQIHNAYDANAGKVVTVFYDSTSVVGQAFVFQTGYTSTPLTAENYIGIARSGAADTAGAIIDTQGAIADIPVINYVLSNASYDSVRFNSSSQDGRMSGIAFNTNGTKMYLVGTDNDSVYQYSLSTPFNVSTASYDSVTLNVSSQSVFPTAIEFNNDGTKMFIGSSNTNGVFQYSLSSGFDLSTASYDSVSFDPSSQESNVQGIQFNNDGTKMYIIGTANNTVFQYSLSSAFNLSTASYDSVSFSVASQNTSAQGLEFNNDGTKLFVVDNEPTEEVYQYDLTTGFDISTASYSNIKLDVSSEDSTTFGISFNADGSKMYLAGQDTDYIYQYSTAGSSLTAGQSYYVQTDGTLGTTAADPSVFAGTAVSATKLIVKG